MDWEAIVLNANVGIILVIILRGYVDFTKFILHNRLAYDPELSTLNTRKISRFTDGRLT